jgi:hypothetical protein
MAKSLTSSLRRFASTIFVFFALFVACVGAQATPCDRDNHPDGIAVHVAVVADDTADSGGDNTLPSLEDNNGGLDDTFDVPPEHAVMIARLMASRPAGVVPASHAHHPNLALRPPNA